MKTGEPGLHARAVFPSEVAFRAQQPHRGRREVLCGKRRSLALLSQPCSCGPLGPQGPCSFDQICRTTPGEMPYGSAADGRCGVVWGKAFAQ